MYFVGNRNDPYLYHFLVGKSAPSPTIETQFLLPLELSLKRLLKNVLKNIIYYRRQRVLNCRER